MSSAGLPRHNVFGHIASRSPWPSHPIPQCKTVSDSSRLKQVSYRQNILHLQCFTCLLKPCSITSNRVRSPLSARILHSPPDQLAQCICKPRDLLISGNEIAASWVAKLPLPSWPLNVPQTLKPSSKEAAPSKRNGFNKRHGENIRQLSSPKRGCHRSAGMSNMSESVSRRRSSITW